MAFEFQDLDTLRSIPDLASYQKAVRSRITDLNTEHSGVPFPEDVREEYAKLKDTDSDTEKRMVELEARKRDVERIAQNGSSVEREQSWERESKSNRRERDVYEVSDIRVDPFNPTTSTQEFRDRAKRALEVAKFPQARSYGKTEDDLRGHIETLLDERDTEDGILARRILVTGNPAYRRAFAKRMSGRDNITFSTDEQRAVERAGFVLGTTGLPVPYQLDPTIIPTSNYSVNPWRSICSVEQIVVNEWRGVTSGAVTAAYAAEGTEASDNTPTLTQPVIDAVRAQAFIPFSIEVSQDWGAIEAGMARLIADAKDDLESGATGFFGGNGTNQPSGINAATTAIDVAGVGGVATFTLADMYNLEGALPPRFRPRANVVANRGMLNRIRQFDTAGGSAMWLGYPNPLQQGLKNTAGGPQQGNVGTTVLGYPVYEASGMLNVLTTGSRIVLMGDFSYYKIVDRVGMSIEVIPHIFGLTRGYPLGQRGLYAFWRNGGKLLAETAFRFIKTA